MDHDFDHPRYLVDDMGELWRGPLSRDNTLHYARFHGLMVVEPFAPIWVLERTNPPEQSEAITDQQGESVIQRYRDDQALRTGRSD